MNTIPSRTLALAAGILSAACALAPFAVAQQSSMNPFVGLMQAAWKHASAHGVKQKPLLSPLDSTVLDGSVDIKALHADGFRIVSWTTNDPDKLRQLIKLGVDGIISDRPDLLQQAVAEARASQDGMDDAAKQRLAHFITSAHRGGRGLRPENTLPSFENGIDLGIDQLETDTGVTTDHVSLIWHDQFLNPQSCRHADGTPYTMENRVYIQDISMPDAQKTFVCDKLHSAEFPDQRNDLSLSPVAVAFAKKEGMPSPYSPTNAAQLFRFVRFYEHYYKSGAGKSDPHAAERAATAAKVTFNLETKIMPGDLKPNAFTEKMHVPPEMLKNHTVGPQVFVDTLMHAINSEHMQKRAFVQSFDFCTLQLIEEQFPKTPTYYLTNIKDSLSTEWVPASLRQPAAH